MNNGSENDKNARLLRIVVGGLIVLFAVVLFVNFVSQLINVDVLLQWWPVAIVAVGLFMASMNKNQVLLGTALSLAGATVLMSRLGLLANGLGQIIQIIAVLLIGLAIMSSRLERNKTDKM
jgi:hypothetical protein